MLKILLLIFLAPFLIGFGIFIAQFVSMILMYIAVGIGSLLHRMLAGKRKHQWSPPEYLGAIQMLIIMGFIFAVYANVLGSILNWHWLLTIGSGLDHLFGALLALDLVVLLILATIHGPFELIQD